MIEKYFPNLSNEQLNSFKQLEGLYKYWNKRINVISRKDIKNIRTNHILHSLTIAKVIRFKEGTQMLDVGTGGGFPGIPLAIIFPLCRFHLIDTIGKKIHVANRIIQACGIKNVTTQHRRIEDVNEKYDFVMGRALTQLPCFVKLCDKNVGNISINTLKNGIFYLKGGNIEKELSSIHLPAKVYHCADFFTEDYFKTKKLIYIET